MLGRVNDSPLWGIIHKRRPPPRGCKKAWVVYTDFKVDRTHHPPTTGKIIPKRPPEEYIALKSRKDEAISMLDLCAAFRPSRAPIYSCRSLFTPPLRSTLNKRTLATMLLKHWIYQVPLPEANRLRVMVWAVACGEKQVIIFRCDNASDHWLYVNWLAHSSAYRVSNIFTFTRRPNQQYIWNKLSNLLSVSHPRR